MDMAIARTQAAPGRKHEKYDPLFSRPSRATCPGCVTRSRRSTRAAIPKRSLAWAACWPAAASPCRSRSCSSRTTCQDRHRLVTLLERVLADERVQRTQPSEEQKQMLARIQSVLGTPGAHLAAAASKRAPRSSRKNVKRKA
ncbi:MAG TPA: hypothetical protein VNU21_06375 [Usitatibacter sp.]|jgi:hypothetical protein|nr:hypothetical protein [Usitatibacter sp.]